MNKKYIIVLIIVTLLVLLGVIMKLKKEYKGSLNIYFFDAGKADAIIITINDKHIMIDTGYEDLYPKIEEYFDKHNITKLDYLIITHFDKDHVGSASKIIDNYEIEHVLQSNYPKDSEYYNNYVLSLEKKEIKPITVDTKYTFQLYDMYVSIDGPKGEYEKDSSNNSSLITSIDYKDTSYLFMGDAENKRINDYLEEDENKYDFIKLPHHGNYKKGYISLLKQFDPKYVVITASDEEPDTSKTEELLNSLEIKYYITKNGEINISSDGKDIIINQ